MTTHPMDQWYSAGASIDLPQLAAFGKVPLELDPRWLNSRVDGPNKRIQYFLLGDQQCLRGYAPFFVHRAALSYCIGEKALFRIPVLRYAMREAPLCENEKSLAGLFELLHETIGPRNVVFFEGVRTDSQLASLLTSPAGLVRKLFHVIPYGPAYMRRLIELPAGAQFDDYLQTLGSGTRKDIRRLRKNFSTEAGGAVKVVCYAQPEQANELAAALAQISRKTYQHHLLGLGIEDTPQYVAQLRAAATAGWLRAYILWVNGAPVAFQLGYHDGHTYYGHHIEYDPALSKLQPGIYLHTELMSDLLANGICRFDFLAGDNLYKQRMSNKSQMEQHYYLIPRGWPGTIRACTLIAINTLSETIGRWLVRSGLKERIKRFVRMAAVKRSASKG